MPLFSPLLMGVLVLATTAAAAATWLLLQTPSPVAAIVAVASVAVVIAALVFAARAANRGAGPAHADRASSRLQSALRDLEMANRAGRVGNGSGAFATTPCGGPPRSASSTG